MNSLEKIFTSIRTSNTEQMKLYSTDELIAQLHEYEDYTLFILKNIYALIVSEEHLNRVCGARLLKSLQCFSYEFNFELSDNPTFTDFVYLQSKELKAETGERDLGKQRSEIKKKLSRELEHVEADFVEEKDMETVTFQIQLKTSEVQEREIANIADFFECLNVILLSPDWYKRHGAFIAYAAVVASENECINFDADMKVEARRSEEKRDEVSMRAEKKNKRRSVQNRTKIRLTGDLFNKIFEILKNDKFSDFQDDVTSSPVREAACVLLRYIFPMINNALILHEITHLLSSKDWQEQFSGLLALSQLKQHFTQDLVDGKGLVDNFFQQLVGQLASSDEDVKFLSADLLSFILENFVVSVEQAVEINEQCWTQIEDEEEIAHSKASFLKLLRVIYTRFIEEQQRIAVPESFAPLYPCFTSPIQLIRDSVFELARVFDAEEFLYLLSEGILLETHGEYREKAILRQKIETCINGETLRGYAKHFFGILSQNIHQPYREDDFACYDDTFFSPDGYKSVGYVQHMNSRAVLFSELVRIADVDCSKEKSVLGKTFRSVYIQMKRSDDKKEHRISNKEAESISNKEDRISNKNNGSSMNKEGVITDNKTNDSTSNRISLTDINTLSNITTPVLSNNTLSNITPPVLSNNTLSHIILNNLTQDFEKFTSLKKMPIKEFRKMLEDPQHLSLYPLAFENCLELVRMHAAEQVFLLKDFTVYFYMEKAPAFLELFCKLLVQSPRVEEVAAVLVELLLASDQQLKKIQLEKSFNHPPKKLEKQSKKDVLSTAEDKSYAELVVEQTLRNVCCFFNVLECSFVEFETFNSVMNSPNRLVFFSYTIKNYHSSNKTEAVFFESLEKKNTSILKVLISEIHYNTLFVKKMLVSFDFFLVASLIEFSDPSFNVLFVKPILKNIGLQSEQGLSDARVLLSTVICSLHFSPNEKIRDTELLELMEREKEEIKMLVDPSLIPEYELAFSPAIELRDYQKEGIRWLAFLSRFNLNGILADDMGLGKTLQVLCFVINEMYRAGVEVVGRAGLSDKPGAVRVSPLRTLVLCPSSLTTHWKAEIQRFFNVSAEIYDSRKATQSNLLVCSYDTLRRDSGALEGIDWSMIVFDEAHVFKNRSTVLYSKIKRLRGQRRFLLTGTPIHNSVDDLFSLFDVLMPNYLGTETVFNGLYGCKVSDRNVEVMRNRLDLLHRKTLPFVMRRLKTEVLKDLPPKIISDISVEMNPQQAALYSKVASLEEFETAGGYSAFKGSSLARVRDTLKAAAHPRYFNESFASSKTTALQEIFASAGNAKVLVFFQFRSTIDFVLEELQLGSYLRLDGSVPPNQRGAVVNRFNTEDIPYLFLTTSVGGLGLNLTSANLVVFYEHDWNPFNDLQAMDRAHRLGQKSSVNVFRLICKGTVEETVMNYQNFKLFVANKIISQQNNEISKMDTKDILERFQ